MWFLVLLPSWNLSHRGEDPWSGDLGGEGSSGVVLLPASWPSWVSARRTSALRKNSSRRCSRCKAWAACGRTGTVTSVCVLVVCVALRSRLPGTVTSGSCLITALRAGAFPEVGLGVLAPLCPAGGVRERLAVAVLSSSGDDAGWVRLSAFPRWRSFGRSSCFGSLCGGAVSWPGLDRLHFFLGGEATSLALSCCGG